MHFPKLSPLQSRLLATLAASVVLVILFFLLTSPQFAYAAELDSRIPPDHNHPLVFGLDDELEDGEVGFEVTAPGQDVSEDSTLATRADSSRVDELSNNQPQNMNIAAGQTQNWSFRKRSINGPGGDIGPGLPSDEDGAATQPKTRAELRRRQNGKSVYITMTTCIQPTVNTSVRPAEMDGKTPPQLLMWTSQSPNLIDPGPGTKDSPDQKSIVLDSGYAIWKIDTSEDVFFGVSAPNTTSWTGIWNYQIAASIDAPFHSFDESWSNLFFVDGDNHAALLVTNDTTQQNSTSEIYKQWMDMPPPYSFFAHNQNDQAILGVQKSFCGLQNQASIMANVKNVENANVAAMVNRGLSGKPKEQFYITALNASSMYYGHLALEGNSTASGRGVVGGGGTVWKVMNFTTKVEDNCALLYNLTFCSEVAYAVPSNPQTFDPLSGVPALAALYDSSAAKLYQNFNYSLQQVPCKTPNVQKYSLSRTCDDCARAYRAWLCAVTIPRCEDFSSPKPYLMPRNTAAKFTNGSSIADSSLYNVRELDEWRSRVATNSSRNPLIDKQIQPGPYKEVLPCTELCYDLMQSCPASLGFACPLGGRGLEVSYGSKSSDPSEISCSYLGAAYYLSRASRTTLSPDGFGLAVLAGTLFWMLWL
jgi:calcium channel MID1